MDDDEEGVFDVDVVQKIVRKVCNTLLMTNNGQSVAFQHAKVQSWTSTIVENILKELAVINQENAKNMQQKYKYIGVCRLSFCPAVHVFVGGRMLLEPLPGIIA